MANNKTRPAAGKSAAGKTNSKKNNAKSKQKQRIEAEKRAQKIIEEKRKAQREREKKSEEIRKRRAKEKEKALKTQKKTQKKNDRINRRKQGGGTAKIIWEKVKYYTSKEFLSSFNYVRIFLFIVLPLVLIIFGAITLLRAVPLNVPAEIRNYEFNGRLESEVTAGESSFNLQQQKIFIDAMDSVGSKKFDFYINSVIEVNDDNSTDKLCFGNPKSNDCILIATVFDSGNRIIYRSLGLESGKEINEARMFESMEYGTHKVTVAVNAYNRETHKKIGTKYAKIKLTVGVEDNGK